jgi:hypothetical protein
MRICSGLGCQGLRRGQRQRQLAAGIGNILEAHDRLTPNDFGSRW